MFKKIQKIKIKITFVFVNITLCFQPVQTCTPQSCTMHWWSTVGHVRDVSVAQGTFGAGPRSLTCKSRENEGCLNAVGHCVVVVTHIFLSCVFLLFPFSTRTTLETRSNVRHSIRRSVKLSMVVSWWLGSRVTSVFSITIQRKLVSTSLPEKSSTMVHAPHGSRCSWVSSHPRS